MFQQTVDAIVDGSVPFDMPTIIGPGGIRPLPPLIGLYSPVMGSGKTTVADLLDGRHGYRKVAFAAALKRMSRALLQSLDVSPEESLRCVYGDLKEVPLGVLGGKTTRYVMQTIGTEWGRGCMGEDFWAASAISQAQAARESGVPIVIDDVRYANEAQAIKDAGGLVVAVYRPGVERQGEADGSEGALHDWAFDWIIMNDEGLDALKFRVDEMAKSLS